MSEGRARLTRQESQHVTRERLIAAARELIVRDGVAAASVRGISEAAGYSQGAFYSNFPTKEHLLMAVLAGHLDGLAGRVEAMAADILRTPRGNGAPAQIADFFRTLNPKSNWSTLAVELQLHANRSVAMQADYSALRDALFRRLGAAFQQIFDHLGVTPGISPEDLAMGLVSTAVGFAIQFGGSVTTEARARFMSAIFQGIIGAARNRED